MQCSKCGNIIKEGMRFCTTCGTPVPNAEGQTEAAPVTSTSDSTVEVQSQASVQAGTQAQAQQQTQAQTQQQTPSQAGTQAQTTQQTQAQAQQQPQQQTQAAYQQPQPQAQAQAAYQQAQSQQQAAYQQQAQTGYQQQPNAAYAQPQTNTTYVYNTSQTVYPAQVLYPRENSGGMLMAAFIFNLITTIGLGFLIIPLAWCIPMTVHSYGIYKGKKPNTVAFGVCTLIFVSLIGGILMLVADKDE